MTIFCCALIRRPDWSDEDVRPVAYAYWIARGNRSGSAEDDWYRAVRFLTRYERAIRVLFFLSLLLCAAFGFNVLRQLNQLPPSHAETERSTPATAPSTQPQNHPTTMPSFLLYGRKSRPPSEWPRDKAVEFGLSQLSARLQSALLGAGAVFWFAMKFLTENQTAKSAGRIAVRWRGFLFLNVILWCGISITAGFLAMLYLSEVAIEPSLEIGGEIQVFQKAQLLALSIAAAVLFAGVTALTLGRYANVKATTDRGA